MLVGLLFAGCGNQPQITSNADSPVEAGEQSDLMSIAKDLCADNVTMRYDVEGVLITRRFEGPSRTVPGLCQETLSMPGKPDREIARVFGMFSGQFIYDPVGQYIYDPSALARGIAPVLQGSASRSRFLIAYVGGSAEIQFQNLGTQPRDSKLYRYELLNYTLGLGKRLPQPNKAFFVDYRQEPFNRPSASAPLFRGERDAGLGSKWPWKTMKPVDVP